MSLTAFFGKLGEFLAPLNIELGILFQTLSIGLAYPGKQKKGGKPCG